MEKRRRSAKTLQELKTKAGIFIPHASSSLQPGGDACGHPTAPFARPGVEGLTGFEGLEGAIGVGDAIGVGGENEDGNGVGVENGDGNRDGDGNGART